MAHVTEIIAEWNGYDRVGVRHGRAHQTVDHSGPKGTWAIDADGDGVREVHGNTQEGLCEVDPIVWATKRRSFATPRHALVALTALSTAAGVRYLSD